MSGPDRIDVPVLPSRLGPLLAVTARVRGLALLFPPLLERPAVRASRAFVLHWADQEASCVRPAGCSPQIPDAPGYADLVRFRPTETVQTANGPRVRHTTVEGLHAARRQCAMERMNSQAARRAPDRPALFTPGQIEAGLAYAALVERVASEGVRCSSLEGQVRGGGGRDWVEGVIARSRRLALMQARIGDDPVIEPRNARAHADRARVAIRTRALVDAVCLGGQSVADILARHGWARDTRTAAALVDALRRAMDRVSGQM